MVCWSRARFGRGFVEALLFVTLSKPEVALRGSIRCSGDLLCGAERDAESRMLRVQPLILSASSSDLFVGRRVLWAWDRVCVCTAPDASRCR